ncbi:MAG: glycosyltransferase [Azoarcus sp.]|jgi:glycosyltransferase involved in cell wall biosynthesis|nr:glycosyltransferase [Azoarcus sp.]
MAELLKGPYIGVLSSLFPSSVQPHAGLSIRERMFRVARRLPLFVVAPTPWVPWQDAMKKYLNKPHFRPGAPEYEEQQGIPVWYPRFLSVPGVFRCCDGRTMAMAAYRRFAAMRHAGHLDVIDAHFAYPDGYAAVLLGRKLGVPVTITLRGAEARQVQSPRLAPKLREALMSATKVFAMGESLRQLAIGMGVPDERAETISDGVDVGNFRPHDRGEARAALGLTPEVPVLISAGWPVDEKGCHRVIEVLPSLVRRWPGLVYLIVGAGALAGHDDTALKAHAVRLGLGGAVRFLDDLPLNEFPGPLSAADVFVLATHTGSGSSAFLEAMACGLPVVTTEVGVSREAVCRPDLGELVPFGEPLVLEAALDRALSRPWDRAAIRRYAETNSWDGRIGRLCRVFSELTGRTAKE